MTFQFSIWDKIRDLGNLSASAISNLVSLLVHLVRTKSLPLSVLKVGVFYFKICVLSLHLQVLCKMYILCYLDGALAVGYHEDVNWSKISRLIILTTLMLSFGDKGA